MTTAAGPLPNTQGRAATAPPREADRSARRAARRVFRPRRVWPALIAAIALTGAGTVVAVEVISGLLDRPARLVPYERFTTWLTETAWNDDVVMAAGAVLALLGLLALLAGLLPGHTGLIRLRTADPDLVMGVTKRGLRTAVASAAAGVDMVSGVESVKARGRRVVVSVASPVRESGDLKERVRDAVGARLDELGTEPSRTVTVRVRHKGA
ncbi:DUF6286 domain-containing protein [Spirillospora sp. NPDC047279]|uniref:DUF6286 domain-containing protein n=1 Tax=Spirillospora sp. NPDC047279 TaxID=3155478 RepID=UPI003406C036